jgi:hypothetical protein
LAREVRLKDSLITAGIRKIKGFPQFGVLACLPNGNVTVVRA